jgi:hypothetical protein
MNNWEMVARVVRCVSPRQLRGAPIRLAMNLLVKNEADVIADNIRVHGKMGVDCFVVMDNGSTDGTRDIVQTLARDHEIVLIDRPVLDYQQSNWKTEMAFVARDRLGADWTIANDADEFWLADGGNLKTELRHWGSYLLCPRYNMLLDRRFREPGYRYWHSNLQVHLPILNKHTDLIRDDHLSIMLGAIHGKVLANAHGLVRVKGGNHRVWHLWGGLNGRACPSIRVHHYPIRSIERFVANIEHRAQLLRKGVSKMGDHYRRWVRLYEAGKLEEELDRLILSDDDIRVLSKFGVVVRNDAPARVLGGVLG